MKRFFLVLAVSGLLAGCADNDNAATEVNTPSTVDSNTVKDPLDTISIKPLDTSSVQQHVDTANGLGR